MASLCRTIRRNGYFITPRKAEHTPRKAEHIEPTGIKKFFDDVMDAAKKAAACFNRMAACVQRVVNCAKEERNVKS